MKIKIIYLIVLAYLNIACSKDDAPKHEEFTDPAFIELLHENYKVPITADGKIDLNDDMTRLRLEAIVQLNIFEYICGEDITDLRGIKNLVNLDKLDLRHHNIRTLDVSGMKNLRSIFCLTSSLASINIQNTPALEEFYCPRSQLTSLDISKHPNLYAIDCSYNKLSSLTLDNLPELTYLDCNSNQISTLNASQMKLYEPQGRLYCGVQKDTNGNDLTLQLTLSEQQSEAWKKRANDPINSNINVKFIQ